MTFEAQAQPAEETLDVYLASDYFKNAGAVLIPSIDGPPDAAYYESERVGP